MISQPIYNSSDGLVGREWAISGLAGRVWSCKIWPEQGELGAAELLSSRGGRCGFCSSSVVALSTVP